MTNTSRLALSKQVKKIPISALRQMPLLAEGIPDVVSLGQGIPDMKTPRYIREGVATFLNENDDIGKYSLQPGLPALKQAIAERLRSHGLPADPDKNICVTAGAMAALASAILAIVESGDEVIVFDPGYPLHVEQILLAGGTPVYVPLDGERGWKLDTEKLRSAVTGKTKAIIVCSPSNPTGSIGSTAPGPFSKASRSTSPI